MKHFFLLIFTLTLTDAQATSKCEGIAGRPGTYLRILIKTPGVSIEDFERVSKSAVPLNPLQTQDRLISNFSDREALHKIIANLRKGEWESIRELAREHVDRLVGEGNLRETGIEKTANVVTYKRAFSFLSYISPPNELTSHVSSDGHTYFAYQDHEGRVQVRREDGHLIWISPRDYIHAPPIRTLTESEGGKLKIELSGKTVWNEKLALKIESFELPSGASSERHIEIPNSNRPLSGVAALPSGERYYLLSGGRELFVIVDQDGEQLWLQGSTSPDQFKTGPNGETVFLHLNEPPEIFRIVKGKREEFWKGSKDDAGAAHIIASREGRIFVNYRAGSILREILHNDRPDLETFASKNKSISFLETPDGRMLLLMSGWINDQNFKTAVYDITKDHKLIFEDDGVAQKHLEAYLAHTSAGTLMINRADDTVKIFKIEGSLVNSIGEVRVTGDGSPSGIIVGNDKVFFYSGTKLPGINHEYTVYQIVGRET